MRREGECRARAWKSTGEGSRSSDGGATNDVALAEQGGSLGI